MEELTARIRELFFWLHLMGGLALWYVTACLFARVLFNSGTDAIHSARTGAILGVVVASVVTSLSAWFRWHSLATAVSLGSAVLVVPVVLLVCLLQAEPAPDN